MKCPYCKKSCKFIKVHKSHYCRTDTINHYFYKMPDRFSLAVGNYTIGKNIMHDKYYFLIFDNNLLKHSMEISEFKSSQSYIVMQKIIKLLAFY